MLGQMHRKAILVKARSRNQGPNEWVLACGGQTGKQADRCLGASDGHCGGAGRVGGRGEVAQQRIRLYLY